MYRTVGHRQHSSFFHTISGFVLLEDAVTVTPPCEFSREVPWLSWVLSSAFSVSKQDVIGSRPHGREKFVHCFDDYGCALLLGILLILTRRKNRTFLCQTSIPVHLSLLQFLKVFFNNKEDCPNHPYQFLALFPFHQFAVQVR